MIVQNKEDYDKYPCDKKTTFRKTRMRKAGDEKIETKF